jgi:Ca2+-binding RTX toxin-like protein
LFKVEVPFDGLAFEDANAPNVILDRGGSDNLRAKGGDDLIISDSWDGQAKTLSLLGDDTINSGSGDDLVIDRGGDNVIRTGAGDDAIFTSLIVDIPPGTLPDFPDGLSTSFTGDDSVVAGDGNDEVNTGAGDDTILGGTGADTIYGGAGSDLIETGPGKDVVFLGDDADNDRLRYDGFDQVSTDVNETDIIFQFSGPTGDQVDMTGIVDVDAGDKIVLLSADLGVGGAADDILVGVDLISDGLDGFDFFVAILADVSLGTIGIGNFPPADSFDDFIIL